MQSHSQTEKPVLHPSTGEEGYMLLAVVVMVALVLVALAIAAPEIAKDLRRDKELESQRRANQYVRAVQLYYRKVGSYPGSLKALEKTNNVRFLRQKYVDPLTGKSDWKVIHQGEQKTKIHVFFGKELAEVSAGLGSAAGIASPAAGASGFGSSTVSSTNALNAGFGGATTVGASGASGTTGAAGSTGSTGSTGSSDSGTGMFGDSGAGGIIVGVDTARSGNSITNPNQQTTYDTWEFWYDPRIELLRKSVNITGGGISSQAASSFGVGLNGQSNSTSGAFGSTGSTGSTGIMGSTGSTGSTNPFP
jgi:type II secretory pathway pseudopilin PulG